MALHKIEVGEYDSPVGFRRDNSAIEFIQLYARKSSPEVFLPNVTYAQSRSFDSRHVMGLNIVRPDFIDSVKRNLIERTIEMNFKGFVTLGFGIKIGNSDKILSVDAFDPFHMQQIVDLHELTPKKTEPSSSLEF